MTKSTAACIRADRFVAAGSDTRKYTNPCTLANGIFAIAEPQKLQVSLAFQPMHLVPGEAWPQQALAKKTYPEIIP
jgi:hypothetical protein